MGLTPSGPFWAGDAVGGDGSFPRQALPSSSAYPSPSCARAGQLFSIVGILEGISLTRASNKAMPPHNPLFGHLLLVASIAVRLPSHAHGHYLADLIRRRYPELGTAFYLDLWPFTPTVLVVISPTLAAQFTQERLLPKHPGLRRFFGPLTGKQDLLSMEGPAWKTWRGIFNPGFSTAHLMTLVPAMMKDVSIFCDQLQEHARQGDVFSLEEMTLNVTIDVIGRVAL